MLPLVSLVISNLCLAALEWPINPSSDPNIEQSFTRAWASALLLCTSNQVRTRKKVKTESPECKLLPRLKNTSGVASSTSSGKHMVRTGTIITEDFGRNMPQEQAPVVFRFIFVCSSVIQVQLQVLRSNFITNVEG